MAIVASIVVMLTAAASPAAARSRRDDPGSCASPDGPKCAIRLSTGVTMRYIETGPHFGAPVFLLHGFADSITSWATTLPVLHRLLPFARIIVPDLRGHPATKLPTGANCPAHPEQCFRPIDYADDIIAFMDAEHISSAAIVGHSVGSLVGQELALSFPRRVNSLVLVSTGTDGQQPLVEAVQDLIQQEWQADFAAAGYDWPAGVYSLTPGVAVPDFPAFIDYGYDTSSIAPPALLSRIQTEAQSVPVGTWIGTVDDLVTADNSQRLHHLSVPTLALWGVQDDVFSPDVEQKLIDSLEVAASRGNPFYWKQYGALAPPADGEQTDLGHNLPWEAPVGLAHDIASFLLTGRPTCTEYRADYPTDIHRIVAVPDHAIVVHGGPPLRGPDCTHLR